MPKINYSNPMPPIPEPAENILLDIMRLAGVDSVLITSTTRNPVDQARIMYDNLEGTKEGQGIEEQRKLYKAPGNAVIDVYEHCKAQGMTINQVRVEMVRKILEIGPQMISHHCTEDTTKRSIFDVAPSSIPDSAKRKFENLVAAHGNVNKFLMPPRDPCYHIELDLTNENSGEETVIQSA
jgi:hypothetical protein